MPAPERLWAPWRSGYLARHTRRGCIFCAAKRAARRDRANYVVARGRQVFAMLNLYPYNNGHLMIAPYRHVTALAGITPSEWTELLRVSQRLTRRLGRMLHPQAYNVGFNIGRASGAGFDHLHLHVVPRWAGDTNFMPVLARTKVISQSLEALYDLLAEQGAA